MDDINLFKVANNKKEHQNDLVLFEVLFSVGLKIGNFLKIRGKEVDRTKKTSLNL